MKPKSYAGSKTDPHLVPSITNKRIVGCICKLNSFRNINYFIHSLNLSYIILGIVALLHLILFLLRYFLFLWIIFYPILTSFLPFYRWRRQHCCDLVLAPWGRGPALPFLWRPLQTGAPQATPLVDCYSSRECRSSAYHLNIAFTLLGLGDKTSDKISKTQKFYSDHSGSVYFLKRSYEPWNAVWLFLLQYLSYLLTSFVLTCCYTHRGSPLVWDTNVSLWHFHLVAVYLDMYCTSKQCPLNSLNWANKTCCGCTLFVSSSPCLISH